MKTFSYTIKNQSGIHARPAGMLVRLSESFESNITLQKAEKTTDLKKLLSLMQMGISHHDTVTVIIDGADEDTAFLRIKAFFEESL